MALYNIWFSIWVTFKEEENLYFIPMSLVPIIERVVGSMLGRVVGSIYCVKMYAKILISICISNLYCILCRFTHVCLSIHVYV